MANDEGTEDSGESLIEFDADPAAAMASILDALAPEAFAQPGAESTPEAPAPSAGDLAPALEGEGAGTEPGAAAPSADGDAGTGVVPGQSGTGFDAAELTPKWGEITEALETRQRDELKQEAFAEVREEHSRYFEALQQHPRLLAGTEVPSLRGEGMETLRDSEDAKNWQEAVKQTLMQEVQDRAGRKADDVRPMMETLHSSINLFQSNPDLIPGSRQFDPELANQFAALAKPYELRVAGKLSGYTIPVAGLVSQVREQLKAKRAAAPAAPAAPSAQQSRAADQTRNDQGQFFNPDAPQASIVSRAGNESVDATEDFSTLFAAFGVPNLKL